MMLYERPNRVNVLRAYRWMCSMYTVMLFRLEGDYHCTKWKMASLSRSFVPAPIRILNQWYHGLRVRFWCGYILHFFSLTSVLHILNMIIPCMMNILF